MPKKDGASQLKEIIEPFIWEWKTEANSENDAFRDWAVSQVLWDLDLS